MVLAATLDSWLPLAASVCLIGHCVIQCYLGTDTFWEKSVKKAGSLNIKGPLFSWGPTHLRGTSWD